MRNRSIRRISIAVGITAIFAAVMVAPTSAFATNKIQSSSASGSTILEGEQSGLAFEIPGAGKITCSAATFNGTMTGSETEEVTLHPVYNKEEKTCSSSSLGATQITSTGCNIAFAGVPAEKEAAGSLAIQCEAGKAIQINAGGCLITIGSQTVSGFHYSNGGGEYLTDQVEASGISYTATGFICSLGGVKSGTNGTWKNNIKVKGYENEGGKKGQVNLWFGTPRTFYVQSKTHKAFLKGSGGLHFVGVGGGVLYGCSGVTKASGHLEGEGEVFSTSKLSLYPEFSSCQGGPLVTTGCNFVLTGDVPAVGISGSLGIECEAGKAIEFSKNGCTTKFGSQTPLWTVAYSSLQPGGPNTRSIGVSLKLEHIHVTSTGSGCGLFGIPASSSQGSLTADFTLEGWEDVNDESGFQAGVWLE